MSVEAPLYCPDCGSELRFSMLDCYYVCPACHASIDWTSEADERMRALLSRPPDRGA